MPTNSATDFATRALRLLNAIDAIDTPSADLVQAAFTTLNEMLDNWATQRQSVYTTARTVFSLTANVASYTLGTGGVWNIARPSVIDRVSIIPTNSGSGNTGPLEIPIGPPLDIAAYQRIAIKTATGTYPTRVYWDRDWTAGLSTVYVYPIPTSSTAAIVLYTPTALTQFADFATQYTFPPGYAKAIRYNLAVELAPEMGIDVPPEVMRIAMLSLGDLKRANFQPLEARFDRGLVGRGGYDILTDEWH